MASLADLFNPSFFIILGIVTLLIALVVVYFESKMREQNHKIAAMLSLVSTLTEEATATKIELRHLANTTVKIGSQSDVYLNTLMTEHNSLEKKHNEDINNNLIEVSDDESEYDNEDEDEVEDDEINSNSEFELLCNDDDNCSSESDEDVENIKVIKLNISDNNIENNTNYYEETNNLDFEPEDELAILDETDEIPEISEEYTEEMLSLKYDEGKVENSDANESFQLEVDSQVPCASELKTISINLGEESQSENIDYRKLQLPKLRSIAVEKSLISFSEAQKLKKPDLLKLLGVE